MLQRGTTREMNGKNNFTDPWRRMLQPFTIQIKAKDIAVILLSYLSCSIRINSLCN